MRKNLFLVLLLAIISGCVSTKNIPIDDNALSKDKKHSVIVSKREKPDFSAMTAGKATFGLLGAVAMITAGNDLIEKNGVEDPASYIGEKLTEALKNEYDIELINDEVGIIEGSDTEEISDAYNLANLVVDVQTVNWSFTYFPTDWNNYRVIYTAKLRLIDTGKKASIAEGFCARIPEQDENSPTYDQLTGNNAEGLKKELLRAADYCVDHFMKETLKIAAKETSDRKEVTAVQQ